MIAYIEDVPDIEVRGDMFLISGQSGHETVQFLLSCKTLAIFQARAERVLKEEFIRRMDTSNVIPLPPKKRRKRV